MQEKILKGRIPLAFGGAAISGEGGGYGFGDISETDALKLVDFAFEKGIRTFDTAPIYGFGLSEQRLGKALKDKREKVCLISKSGVTWHSTKRVDMTNDPKVTQKMLEQSLKDLQTEYIDLYMIHWPDEKVDIRRPVEVLAKAKDEGKIRAIGLCNTFIEDFEKASEVVSIDVIQAQLNIFQQENLELIDYTKKKNIPFMSWGTLDKGFLTGTVHTKRTFDASDCRSWAPWWKSIDKDERYQKREKILEILNPSGHSLVELALGYNKMIMGDDGFLLCGGRNQKQWDGLLTALDHLPPRELIERCLKAMDED